MQNDSVKFFMSAINDQNIWLFLGGVSIVSLIVALLVFIKIKARGKQISAKPKLESQTQKAIQTAGESMPKVDATLAILPAAEAPQIHDDIQDVKSQSADSWLNRLKSGLSRTRTAISEGIGGLFQGGAKIDDSTLERIHEVLYRADVGVATADRLVTGLRTNLAGQTVEWNVVKDSLAAQAGEIFAESNHPINMPATGLYVVLVVGVNGVGKTTTIGKLAARFTAEGKKVMLCAADTFRAAAIEQLMVWGERNNVPVIKHQQGADPAAVSFDGVQAAKARGMDILIIDTAGRLHNKNDLMVELSKINRSIGKGYEGAPHETWIVVDATTGQNAVQQVKAFGEVTKLSGIVVTKLDGTAKGGVIIGIANQFKIPIRYIGVGEKASDLKEFNGMEFMRGLLDS